MVPKSWPHGELGRENWVGLQQTVIVKQSRVWYFYV